MAISPVAATSLELATAVRVRSCTDSPEEPPAKQWPSNVYDAKGNERSPDRWRWMMLGILSVDICVSYLPYYTFVPILRQGTQVYSVDENALNVLCILYALVYVPGAFLTGPVVGALGCRWTFVLAMGLTSLGCVLRCGPGLLEDVLPVLLNLFNFSRMTALDARIAPEMVVAPPAPASFGWLVTGQAICALGQPFLVNSTSELGAEWFPPHERPMAALLSNLMNFIGASLSFVLPPLLVEEQDRLDVAERQLAWLLELQLLISAVTFVVTLTFYRPAPRLAKREAVPFLSEVRGVLAMRDFWLINGYFAIYVAACHAFDAVEGSLLERYGYSAALSSWTGVSCGVASVIISVLESWYIVDASAYQTTLVASSAAMALSLLLAFLCLHFHMHSSIFVGAIFIMGLSVPAWGCSCELGSEVCFPAREATVSSILEAFSNLVGVVSIIGTQHLLDQGLGAGVLLLMALATLVGASLLFGTSGRLRRSEAEAAAELPEEVEKQGVDKCALDVPPSPTSAKMGSQNSTPVRLRRVLLSIFGTLLLCRVLLLIPQSQLPEEFAESLSEGSSAHIVQLPRPKPGRLASAANATASGAMEPQNYVIHCGEDKKRLVRFSRRTKKAGINFTVAACAHGDKQTVSAAVRDGLLPHTALMATSGRTRQGLDRATLIGMAIAHLRLLKSMVESTNETLVFFNVFEDTEVVHENFRRRRRELLARLPQNLDFVKLNVLRPAGKKLTFGNQSAWTYGKVLRILPRTSPMMNLGLGNYVVTRHGAKRILQVGRKYDTYGSWELFDAFLLARLYSSGHKKSFQGFVVQTNTLSTHCDHMSRCFDDHGRSPRALGAVVHCWGRAGVHQLCREQ